jgi:serine phosphatase RsbU (regulator of sigma subunit)
MLRRLINTGVTSDLSPGLTRKIRIVNLASLLTSGLFGFFTIVLIVKALWVHAAIYVFFTSLFTLPVVLNGAQRHRLSRGALIVLLAFALTAVEVVIRSNSRGIFIVCLLLLGTFLADTRRETALVYAFIALLYLAIKSIPMVVDVSQIRMESQFAFWVNLLIGALGLYMLVNTFISDGWKYQRELADTNRQLELKWTEADEEYAKAARQAAMLTRKNAEVRALSNDLLDGIRYARRIQNSMLVTKEQLHQHLTETLIFYKPKDVLSGDFYWFAEVEGHLFLAVADCTGHGVPGALMTVMGNNLLHQIVGRDEVVQPSAILAELDRRVVELLGQRNAANDVVNDGMDMALLRIDPRSGQMLFASAKRPLYAFHGGSGVLTEYPASKQSIGGHRTEGKSFTDVDIPLMPNDTFYLTSDGYTDQFGPQGKFMPKRFRQLLADVHQQPMPEQHRLLNETLLRWRLQEPQTDDVLVFGFRYMTPQPC